MLLFLSLTGFVLSFLLLYFNARKFGSSVYLSLFFFFNSLYLLVFYALYFSKSVVFISVLYINFGFLGYLTGPALYFYLRSVLNDDSRLKMKDVLHLLPAVLYLLTSLPFIFSAWSFKTGIANLIAENIVNLKLLKPTVIFDIIPAPVIYLSRPAIALFYTAGAAYTFVRWIKHGKKKSVLHHQQYLVRWLIVLLVFFSLMLISHIIPMILAYSAHRIELFFTFDILQKLSAAGLIGLLVSVFFFPGILYGLPNIPDGTGNNTPSKTLPDPTPSVAIMQQKNAFEGDYLEMIGQKADRNMAEHQCYLRNDCNLSSFAKMLEIPAHHLAYYFREVKKQPFNMYRNEWRVKHAISIIEDGSHPEMTLEAIGRLSGFASKNTFFAAFKKSKGTTPGEFAESIKKRPNTKS